MDTKTGQVPGWPRSARPSSMCITALPPPLLLQIWYFECNNWLDDHEGDGKLERLLPAQLHNPRSQRNMYYIVVKTDTVQGSGTDANVYVDIMGKGGKGRRRKGGGRGG